jgi:predicted  nucleic acid-binding Zn-ribbon protein
MGAFALTAAAGLSAAVVFAQETPAAPQIPEGVVPSNIQKGPTAAEIELFQQEAGAPISAFNDGAVKPPDIPEPETIPEDVKKIVPQKDLVDLYCAMTRWKSGDFYLAMGALKKYLIPAIEQARGMGMDISAPDVAGMTAEGTKRITAICAAKTVDDAERLAKDFAQWGRDSAAATMTGQRGEMESKMKTQGDALRDKVTKVLQPYIDAETAKIEPEIQAKAESIAQSIVAGLDTSKAPPDTSWITAQVEEQLKPIIEAKRVEIEAKIKAKANEITGPEVKKFQAIGDLFKGMDEKINAEIKAGAGKYAAEKAKALSLRKNLILKMIDANLATAATQLDGAAADIDKARAMDPSLKSVAEMKADLQQDRKDLAAKLDAALASGDENKLVQIFADFEKKWVTVQEDGNKAAAESVTKMCKDVTTQLASAKAQMQPAIDQITSLQQQCSASTDDQCNQVQALSSRFGTITGKMSDILREMDLAQKLCDSGSTDPNELVAMLRKIQQDGEDAQTFGAALEADKATVLAGSVKSACNQALPQLKAARVELTNNDLVVLKSKLDTCLGKTTPECAVVNDAREKYQPFKDEVDAFLKSVDQVTALCTSSKSDADYERILSTLSDLKDQSDQIIADGKDLKELQSGKAGAEAYCRAIREQVPTQREAALKGMNEAKKELTACKNVSTPRCAEIAKLKGDIDNITSQVQNVFKNMDQLEKDCKQGASHPSVDQLASRVDALQQSQKGIEGLLTELRAKIAKAEQSKKGIWIEAENEIASFIKPVSSRPAVNMKETNPSWRPPFYGTGDWYLASEGEWLKYAVSVPTDGVYNVWVRDYIDKFQAAGVRRVILDFDGKRLTVFREVDKAAPGDKGIFGWHKVASIMLKAGDHTMMATKEKTTSGAAILDAFYLTTGTEVPPEK